MSIYHNEIIDGTPFGLMNPILIGIFVSGANSFSTYCIQSLRLTTEIFDFFTISINFDYFYSANNLDFMFLLKYYFF